MNLILPVQIFLAIIVVGVIYNLWRTTKAFGGLIGIGLKWIGLGIVFFSLEALDRVLTLGGLSFVESIGGTELNQELIHHLLLLFGLLFSAIGFSRLTKISK